MLLEQIGCEIDLSFFGLRLNCHRKTNSTFVCQHFIFFGKLKCFVEYNIFMHVFDLAQTTASGTVLSDTGKYATCLQTYLFVQTGAN